MAQYNFLETIEFMAYSIHGDPDQHFRFMTDGQTIVTTLGQKLRTNESHFGPHMQPMLKTTANVKDINVDMPLTFEVFLPLRLPYAMKPTFSKQERTVQLKRSSLDHPFFYGNMINAKFMNFLLQHEMMDAVEDATPINGNFGAVYDLRYVALSYNNIPFAHQIFAHERGSNGHGIHIDFILALEFDGAVMPLPAYYKSPLTSKWLAFGLVPIDDHHDGSHWAVLVPRWQTDRLSVRLHCLRMMQLLYRMLYAQGCYCFSVPVLVKFAFFMTTADRGDDYRRMSLAELMITTLGHQAFRNFCELIVASRDGDPLSNIQSTKSLREQQVRCKGLFAMLAKGFQLNVMSSEFILKFFEFDAAMLASMQQLQLHHQQRHQQELEQRQLELEQQEQLHLQLEQEHEQEQEKEEDEQQVQDLNQEYGPGQPQEQEQTQELEQGEAMDQQEDQEMAELLAVEVQLGNVQQTSVCRKRRRSI